MNFQPLGLQQTSLETHCPACPAESQRLAWFWQGVVVISSNAQFLNPGEVLGRHPRVGEQHNSGPKHRNESGVFCKCAGPQTGH